MSNEEEQEVRRQDLDAYCPRVDQSVLILGDTCFFPDKKAAVCRGCVFDGDFITVKVILLAAEMLQQRDSAERKNSEKRVPFAGVEISTPSTLEVEQK